MRTIKTQSVEIIKEGLIANMPEEEYLFIRNIGEQIYKDERLVRGLVKAYAVIWCYSYLCPSSRMLPIHSNIFKTAVSIHNYSRHLDALASKHVIQYKKSKIVTYADILGKSHIRSESPKCFMLTSMGHQYSNNIFFTRSGKTIPIKLRLDELSKSSLVWKRGVINNTPEYIDQQQKIEKIIETPDEEVYCVKMTIRLVNDILNGKLKDPQRFNRRVREISLHYRPEESLKTKEYIISPLVDKLLKIIKKNNNNKIINEHIAESYLLNRIDNQTVRWQKKRRNINKKLAYYQNLRVDPSVFEKCYKMTDLYHLARINEVPKYHYPDKKIYSKLAGLRKPLRKYIFYGDSRLVEASDIRSAHFTMLPAIFEKSNIIIPEDEFQKYVTITQTKDLYVEAASNSSFSRQDIKTVFQPFFSIKNEKQFLYNQKDDEFEKRKVVCTYFKENFPSIYSALLQYHTNNPGLSIKRVANEVESEIINDICDEIRQSGLHPFRVHDAIYMSEDESKMLTINIKEEVFKRINNYRKLPSGVSALASQPTSLQLF